MNGAVCSRFLLLHTPVCHRDDSLKGIEHQFSVSHILVRRILLCADYQRADTGTLFISIHANQTLQLQLLSVTHQPSLALKIKLKAFKLNTELTAGFIWFCCLHVRIPTSPAAVSFNKSHEEAAVCIRNKDK